MISFICGIKKVQHTSEYSKKDYQFILKDKTREQPEEKAKTRRVQGMEVPYPPRGHQPGSSPVQSFGVCADVTT